MSAGFWKYLATAALSIVVTLTGAWMSVNAQAVTKSQVQDMIQPDRETLRELRDDVKSLSEKLDALNREMGELKGMLRR